MAGDLTASKIKREYKIKDFGNLLPGHGGIMDRFDSVLFVAPTVYYFILHFI
jgi:phosphatidate cytidylyltransferase